MSHFEKYQDAQNEWRWKLRATNGKIIADSAEGYSSERNCDDGIALVKSEAAEAQVRKA